MDSLSATSRVEKVVVMKVSGIGATEMGNTWIGYVMQHAPGGMLLAPGVFVYSRGARDVKFTQPAPAGGYMEYTREHKQTIGAGWGVPYDLLTGDLTAANYSSLKAGRNVFRLQVAIYQWLIVIPMFCRPVWRRFIDASYAAGRIRAVNYGVEWTPPKFPAVDQLKDSMADQLDIRSGLELHPEKLAERGYDPVRFLAEYRKWMAQVDEANAIFDSDARRTTGSGAAQSLDGLAAILSADDKAKS